MTTLDVRDLTVEFRQGRSRPPLRALDTVSLQIGAGEASPPSAG
jgi:ABC-type glutathione transport system ATPase component